MTNCGPLFWYGIIMLAITGASVIVPYLQGKSDLISGWNLLLGGVAIFVGIGAIEAAVSPMRFTGVQWFEPTRAEVMRWAVATTVFVITLLVAHRYDPLSPMLAARVFNKWPPISTGLILFVVFFCLGLAFLGQIPAFRSIAFFGAVVVNVSHKGLIAACVFSFVLWNRNKTNLVWLGLFIFVLLSTCLLAVLASSGRRLVLSVFLAPVIAFYYYQARQWRPVKCFSIIAVALVGVFCLSLFYSMIRHFDRRGEMAERGSRTASGALKAVQNIHGLVWLEHFTNDMLWGLSQHAVHYGMLTDRFITMGELQVQPLNTFKFMAVYPIPRRIWRDKPVSLGRVITTRVLKRSTSWGTGVAGHSAYEGGPIVAAMFGYLAAFGIRFFDDPLRRQPTNPFLIAMLSAAAMHVIAWPRGDLSVMTFEVAECIFFTMALSWFCRFLFGTDKTWVMNRMAIPSGRVVYQAPAR